MARQGITFEQVAAAADALVGEGQQPSIRAVRERLGDTGSPNTIHRHLAAWRDARPAAAAAAPELPQTLAAAIATEIAQAASRARAEIEGRLVQAQAEAAELATVGEAMEAERDELAEQVAVLTTERDRWEATAAERQAEIERQVAELLRERTAAEHARIETAQSRNKLELQAERLVEQVEEISKLRNALDYGQQARQQAEQLAAVAAARLEAETEQRKALAEQLAEAAKRATSTADQLSHEKVSGQACQARLEAAAREISAANEAATKAREQAVEAREQAARLGGQLDVLLRQDKADAPAST